MFCVHQASSVIRVLTAAMNLNKSRKFFPPAVFGRDFWKPVDGSQFGFLTFENADAESDDS
jgi:hypothetical protein